MHDRKCSNQCDDFPIGMGYIPWQEFRNLYEPEKGLHAGTIFMELDKPFTGRRPYRR
ncbi:MAG: spore coat associated protein CotJA [Lachnospiraceae bacterium]|nr:spore coat associated protein CotJA [Lachnospiraceae bacterium]